MLCVLSLVSHVHFMFTSKISLVLLLPAVYGNINENSGTGVCFTRNPANGTKELFGEFLMNAQVCLHACLHAVVLACMVLACPVAAAVRSNH